MKRITTTRKTLAGIALAASSLFAVSASAAIITNWDWTTDGGFVNAGDGNPGAATCNNGPTQASCNINFAQGVTPSGIPGTSSIISWGTPSNPQNVQSALQGVFGASGAGPFNAQNFGSGMVEIGANISPSLPNTQPPITASPFEQIITNGGWTNTGAAVHYNNVITQSGGAMRTTRLTTSFQLLTPGPGPVATTNLDIRFRETPNQGDCPQGNPHGTTCDDVFELTGSLAPVLFNMGGQWYKLSFRFADGPGAIVQGSRLFTAELSPGTSVVLVQGRIDTITLPLPGVPALLGIGLMLVGWSARGRKLA